MKRAAAGVVAVVVMPVTGFLAAIETSALVSLSVLMSAVLRMKL